MLNIPAANVRPPRLRRHHSAFKMHHGTLTVILAIFVFLALLVPATTAAFVPPYKSIMRFVKAQTREASFTQQSADKKELMSEKNYFDSTANGIPRGGAKINEPPPPVPPLSTYRKFSLPCLGLWVAQPLLSLIDTSFVGLSGDKATSAQQLAALGVRLTVDFPI